MIETDDFMIQAGSDSDSDSDDDTESSDSDDDEAEDADKDAIQAYVDQLFQSQLLANQAGTGAGSAVAPSITRARAPRIGGHPGFMLGRQMPRKLTTQQLLDTTSKKAKKSSKKGSKKRGSKLEYKRVDQLWDSTIHNYKLTDTAEDVESSEYDQYCK